MEWVIYQPDIKDATGSQPALNLFTLQQSNYHLLGKVTCNDPSIKNFNKDVKVYSSSDYKRVYSNNIVYLLFSAQNKGYAYVNIDKEARGCALANFTSIPASIAPDQLVQDFVVKESPLSLVFTAIPESDFKVECSVVRLDKTSKTSLIVSLNVEKEDRSELISQQKITNSKEQDFTMVFKKLKETSGKLKLSIETDNNDVEAITVKLAVGEPHLVEVNEIVYFQINKGEEFKFKVAGNPDASQKHKLYLIARKPDELNLSKEEALQSEDFEFTVTAKEASDNSLMLSPKKFEATEIKNGKGLFEFEEIEFLSVDRKLSHRIRMGESVYMRKKMQRGKALQVAVNTPNVIIYAASDS